MPENLPAELVDLRQRVESLCRNDLIPIAQNSALDQAERTRQIRLASRTAGVFPMNQPKSHGGTEASALAVAVARDTLGRHNVGHVAGIFGPSPGPLSDVGEPLRSDFLTPFMAGELRSGFAFTEPDDAPRHTWAVLDGDELVVTGQKSYVTGGADADFVNVLVEVEDGGPVMVLIETDREGVELTRRFGTLDGSHHAAFRFDQVRVPRHHVIGEHGGGMRVALSTVTRVRMAIAADCVGLCGYLADYLSDYLAQPHRSGQPLGSLERNRLRYGDLRVRAYAARAMLYRTARLIDSGENAVNEAMGTKLFATETVGDLIDTAIQIVGGQALSDDHPLAGIHRRVRVLRLAEGASDVLRINVARGDLDLGLGRI